MKEIKFISPCFCSLLTFFILFIFIVDIFLVKNERIQKMCMPDESNKNFVFH